MADRVTKNGGFTGPAGSDSASVDTLLEGVLGGDVQSAKARVPNRARQETSPGLSVILEEEPPMGGRRKAFLPEDEQIARMAPTIPSSLRDAEIPRDTVVAEDVATATHPSTRRGPWMLAWVVVALLGVAGAGLWWGTRSSQTTGQDGPGTSTAASALKLTTSLSSNALPVPNPSMNQPLNAVAPALPTSAATAATPTSSTAAPSSTYGHLVPGGRH